MERRLDEMMLENRIGSMKQMSTLHREYLLFFVVPPIEIWCPSAPKQLHWIQWDNNNTSFIPPVFWLTTFRVCFILNLYKRIVFRSFHHRFPIHPQSIYMSIYEYAGISVRLIRLIRLIRLFIRSRHRNYPLSSSHYDKEVMNGEMGKQGIEWGKWFSVVSWPSHQKSKSRCQTRSRRS